MSNQLLVASLITLAGVVADSPEVAARRMPPPPPPPVARCDAHAPVLASVVGHVANSADPNAVPTDWMFSVRDSGRWDFAMIDMKSHVVSDAVNGCSDTPATDKLRATLRAAPWKLTPIIHCMAVSAASTEYSVNGKAVWSAVMCPSSKLDTVSANAIAALDELVANARKPAVQVGGGPAPAACTIEGKPFFEQSFVDDAAPSGVDVALYRNGAWLRTMRDGKKPAVTTQGCLSPSVLASVRADLDAAPWTFTHPKFQCRAMSTSHTIYRVDGKDMWDRRLCASDTVDAATDKSLAHIRETLQPIVKLDL